MTIGYYLYRNYLAMEDVYFIVSDGSVMEIESFIFYVYYLKKTVTPFSFTDWFCEDDFSDVDTYNYLENLFQK